MALIHGTSPSSLNMIVIGFKSEESLKKRGWLDCHDSLDLDFSVPIEVTCLIGDWTLKWLNTTTSFSWYGRNVYKHGRAILFFSFFLKRIFCCNRRTMWKVTTLFHWNQSHISALQCNNGILIFMLRLTTTYSSTLVSLYSLIFLMKVPISSPGLLSLIVNLISFFTCF